MFINPKSLQYPDVDEYFCQNKCCSLRKSKYIYVSIWLNIDFFVKSDCILQVLCYDKIKFTVKGL